MSDPSNAELADWLEALRHAPAKPQGERVLLTRSGGNEWRESQYDTPPQQKTYREYRWATLDSEEA